MENGDGTRFLVGSGGGPELLDDGTGGELAPVAGGPFLLQILGTFLSTGDRIRIVENTRIL